MSEADGGVPAEDVPTGDAGGVPKIPTGADTGDGGGGPTPSADAWRNVFSDDYKTLLDNKNFKSGDDLLKSYVAMEKKMGGATLSKPTDKFTEDQWREHFISSGAPESPDGYGEYDDSALPDDFKSDQVFMSDRKASLDKFRAMGVARGLLPRQMNGLIADITELEVDSIRSERLERSTAIKAQHDALIKEWGPAYERNSKFAQAAIDTVNANLPYGVEPLFPKGYSAEGDPAMLRLLSFFGRNVSEDVLVSSSGNGNVGPRSHSEAKAEYQKFCTDNANAIARGDPDVLTVKNQKLNAVVALHEAEGKSLG